MILNKIFKTLIRTLFILIKLQWFTLFKKHSNKSKYKVIIYPNFPQEMTIYFSSDAFANDIALLSAVAIKYPDYKLIIGTRKMNRNFDSNIFINLSYRFNFNYYRNYSSALVNFIKELEDQNNIVYPSSKEALLWENKLYMHSKFTELSIKNPETEYLNLDCLNINEDYESKSYPLLIKEIHSAGSIGVHLVKNREQFNIIIRRKDIRRRNKFVLVQKLLKMDRDLRVIIIGEEIVLFYWRINQGKDWKPTSTKNGSRVDFENFPEQWRNHIIDEFLKLGVTAGALDLVWEDNNFTNPPYVLEVSTSFQPNPKPPSNLRVSYGQYKTGVSINGWDRRFVDIVFDLKKKLVDCYDRS
jgi:glutathione synthase/RimK-type ligase-like ATP-grasp enzyme